MSIIGPRPLLVSYLPWYTEEEKQRHDVRPGLSGLAQVNGRNSVTWEEKFSWDLKYVDRIEMLKSTVKQYEESTGKIAGAYFFNGKEYGRGSKILYPHFTEMDFKIGVLYLMNRFTVCFGGVWRRIGRIQRGSLI